MSTEGHIEVVLDYFDGCNTGDLEQLCRTLNDDVVHYFLPEVHSPIQGGGAPCEVLAQVPEGVRPGLEDRSHRREW
jgi:hypothetical protein